jgi:hypothetical protein
MIAPASIADWAMLGGLTGALGGFAVLGNRWLLNEAEAEHSTLRDRRPLVPVGARLRSSWTARVIRLPGRPTYGAAPIGGGAQPATNRGHEVLEGADTALPTPSDRRGRPQGRERSHPLRRATTSISERSGE